MQQHAEPTWQLCCLLLHSSVPLSFEIRDVEAGKRKEPTVLVLQD